LAEPRGAWDLTPNQTNCGPAAIFPREIVSFQPFIEKLPDFSLALFPNHAKINALRVWEAAMLAGTVVSAILGGMAGAAYGLLHDHGLMQTLLTYQIGGLVAVLAFYSVAQPVAPQRG
jgi:hypothetical protein